MPTCRSATLATALFIVASAPAFANDDFQLTDHIERNLAASLGVDGCAELVEREANRAGFRAGAQRFEGNWPSCREEPTSAAPLSSSASPWTTRPSRWSRASTTASGRGHSALSWTRCRRRS